MSVKEKKKHRTSNKVKRIFFEYIKPFIPVYVLVLIENTKGV